MIRQTFNEKDGFLPSGYYSLRFKMSKHEYNNLLYEISKKIDATKQENLVFICRDDLPKGCIRDSITTVLTLFEELEKNNRLGIDRLDILKSILTQLKKGLLLKKVEKFDTKRKGLYLLVNKLARSLCKVCDD